MVNLFYSGFVAIVTLLIVPVLSITSYPNEFFTPEAVLRSEWVTEAKWAQLNTIRTAKLLAAQGPWSKSFTFRPRLNLADGLLALAVTSKTMLPPTGNKQYVPRWVDRTRISLQNLRFCSDFLSLLPYFWPDCSGVGNDTELTNEQSMRISNRVRR
jgi:hypothetical protein